MRALKSSETVEFVYDYPAVQCASDKFIRQALYNFTQHIHHMIITIIKLSADF